MIWHFLKQDLASARLILALYIPVIIFTSLIPVPFDAKFQIYFISSFFLANHLMASIAGSKWRNQHAISRSYLLSLPIDRMRLFSILVIRTLIFSIPLALFFAIAPLMSAKLSMLLGLIHSGYLLYLLNVILGIIWMSVGMLSTNFAFEKYSTHLNQKQRYKMIGKVFLLMLLEICVFGSMMIIYISKYPALSTVGMMMLTLFQITLARRQT